jgi:hypothetical protein
VNGGPLRDRSAPFSDGRPSPIAQSISPAGLTGRRWINSTSRAVRSGGCGQSPKVFLSRATILDHGISLPTGIEDTVSEISTEGLWEAARACAGLLDDLWPDATAAIEGQPQPLPDNARWVMERLRRGRP